MADQPISIDYKSLLANDASAIEYDITKAFGSSDDCLGIIILRDLPEEFGKLREDAMRAAARFAALPQATREKYTDPDSHYSFGWSHGVGHVNMLAWAWLTSAQKEFMNGRPDVHKGSYYANPVSDTPGVPEALRLEHPSYLRNNVWPSQEDCPDFERAFKALAKFMTETGKRLAKACDHLVAAHSDAPSIESLIAGSQCSKARLLHYFPPQGQKVHLDKGSSPANGAPAGDEPVDAWCGTHLDHSLLTALCPALYMFQPTNHQHLDPLIVPAPTATAGLYIMARSGKSVKAVIPPGCMAFQTGEALESLTQGRLKATPHWVSPGSDGAVLREVSDKVREKVACDESWAAVKEGVVSRETMAVFLQPDVNAVIGKDGETFGQFTHRILQSHYEKGL